MLYLQKIFPQEIQKNRMKYYIIAGEASGDLHGSNLMKGLYEEDPEAIIRFWGGGLMNAVFRDNTAGTDPSEGIVRDYSDTAVMGFFELIGKLGKLADNLDFCRKDIAAFAPDCLIFIDYPGFNLRIARWAHDEYKKKFKPSLKIFYYIAPKVWATREGRNRQLKEYIDKLFIIFPFEKEYFSKQGIPYIYCGNPLVDSIADSPAMQSSSELLKTDLGLEPDSHLIAMLAGSRLAEVQTMMPQLTGAAAILHSKEQFKDYIFFIAGAPGRNRKDYGVFDESYIRLVFGKTREIVRAADAAVINSGTASLEAVLLNTPQVVAYKLKSKLTYCLARIMLIGKKYISLGNWCIDKLAFKELCRAGECTAENIAEELERLVSDENYRKDMLDDYAAIRESLGQRGASQRVAKAMVQELKG